VLLLLDNRDSFTWNLALAAAELGVEVDVRRSDELGWRDAQALAPDAILIGPGPGTPDRAGASLDVLRELAGSVPILGVCLGHQALGVAYGGRVVRAARLAHGRALPVHHAGVGVFAGLPSPSWFTLYNSLVVDAQAVPDCLEVTAWSEDGEVMGLRHRELDVEGVQFHPESILSENGLALLANFVRRAGPRRPAG
jgi:anthranilate synthase/aminodeoxychorismate synthase-like glutamine amidotransferase